MKWENATQASDFETLENAMKRHLMNALTLTRGNQRQAAAFSV
jgi:hypothetical protein